MGRMTISRAQKLTRAAAQAAKAHATLDSGRGFWSRSTGRWAGEQWAKAIKNRELISPAHLRTLDTLQKDEWKFYDDQVLEEYVLRLRAVAMLVTRGLVKVIPNGLAKTVYEYEKQTDMDDAEVSMDGISRSDNDLVEYDLAGMPLPITHKDFYINLRKLLASRERGEGLDATQGRAAARKCAEKTEDMLINGGKTFQGRTIYGLRTAPDRNTVAFGTNGSWSAAAKTGENVLVDVQTLMGLLEGDRMGGPYGLLIPRNASIKLSGDFKTNSDKTIRQRLLEVDGLEEIITVDALPADNVIMVQLTADVVEMLEGEALQNIQWDVQGGMLVNFKVFQIMVPLVRSSKAGRSGIAHMS